MAILYLTNPIYNCQWFVADNMLSLQLDVDWKHFTHNDSTYVKNDLTWKVLKMSHHFSSFGQSAIAINVVQIDSRNQISKYFYFCAIILHLQK